MFDEHIPHENLGLMPVLNLFGIDFSAYALFMILAFVAAFLCFKLTASKLDREAGHMRFLIVVFALLGGILGAKIPILLYHYDLLLRYPQNLDLLVSGRTIVGGLVGGFLAVFLLKKHLGITIRTGNDIAAPAALGMAVGRIGCLLGGCCYGIPAPAVFGMDLGDGILRYPTQIYEMFFDLALFLIFLYMKKDKNLEPGILFRILLNAYLTFRFFLEFIRETDKILPWLSYYQVLCILCLAVINLRVILKKNRRSAKSADISVVE